jgi:hypothetical protein
VVELHLALPNDVEAQIHQRAEARGVTVDRYVADLVLRDIQTAWPPGFFERVIGSWKDEDIERPDQGTLERRAEL